MESLVGDEGCEEVTVGEDLNRRCEDLWNGQEMADRAVGIRRTYFARARFRMMVTAMSVRAAMG